MSTNADPLDDLWRRPLLSVEDMLRLVPMSERGMRRALAEGGDLHHLAVKVGARVYVKSAAFAEFVGRTRETV